MAASAGPSLEKRRCGGFMKWAEVRWGLGFNQRPSSIVLMPRRLPGLWASCKAPIACSTLPSPPASVRKAELSHLPSKVTRWLHP